MPASRRKVLFNIAPAVIAGGVFGTTTPSAMASGSRAPGEPAVSCGTCNENAAAAKFSNFDELEQAFHELGELSDGDVEQLSLQATGKAPTPRIPLPGPAAIVSCALSAAWIFRNGTSKDRVMGQLAEAVINCVGIPLGSTVTVKVARLIWKYKKKIVAALAAAGLTAAQLAPLKNAPKP